jgi:asparagine synthase (glutamine-hydrolysing)
MCGIAGIYNLKHKNVDLKLVEQMTGELIHRGPDHRKEVLLNNGKLGLGHCRLKVIDLSTAANQPMSNESGSIWITFNGMIYNYRELTDELKRKGHIFKSKSDTEAILHAYEEFKEDCFSRFNGMWSLAIWDNQRKILLCARDRFGIKPFYYYLDGSEFIFASEIKALLKHPKISKKPNYRTIYNYLSYNFGYTDISEETFFAGIKQIVPSQYFVIKDGSITQRPYWNLGSYRKPGSLSDELFASKFYQLFEDAVRIRLRSDVPVGVCLSGGLDSSAIICAAKQFIEPEKIKAFNVSFNDQAFDESAYAKAVADYTGVKLHFVYPQSQRLFDDLSELIWHQEEPFTNLNIYSQWLLMQEARRQGVVVLLNGHGGDEALSGYTKEFYFFFADLIKGCRWPTLAKELSMHTRLNGTNKLEALKSALWVIFSQSMPNSFKDITRRYICAKNKYLDQGFSKKYENYFYLEKKLNSFLNNSSYMNYRICPLPGWLHAEDRMSMAHSIESRSPFLDSRIVELGINLPAEQKFRDGLSKFILRNAMQNRMTEKVRMRIDKMGYPTPTANWLRGSLYPRVIDILRSARFSNRGIFNTREVLKAFAEHCQGSRNLRFTLWSWVNLELWFRRFFD